MSFKNLVRIDSDSVLDIMGVISKEAPDKEIENARQIILEALQDAQEGNLVPLNLLCKWADEIVAYCRKQREKSELADLLRGLDLSPPEFLLPPKNLLSSALGFNTPALEYALTILKAITTIKKWISGEVPWKRVTRCKRCSKFFLKRGRKEYCSDTCRDSQWQTPYRKRKDYFFVRRKFGSLLNRPGAKRKAAEDYLRRTSPYKEIIERDNMDLKNILKDQGGE